MIGEKFQSLTVIEKDEIKNNQLKEERKLGLRSNAPVYYIVECECGNRFSLAKAKIINRKVYGCSKCNRINFNSYIGKTINGWTILDFYKKDKPYFKCECSCGTIKDVNAYNIINNKSKDCGCGRIQYLQSLRKDLSGLKIGKLKVLKPIKRIGRRDVYLCQCDCGKTCEVISYSLSTYHTTSCGCSRSKYEGILFDIVKNLGYDCIKEYQINLSDSIISYIRFDLFVPSLSLAIEFDGEFHFSPIPWLPIDDAIKSLELRQYSDNLKDKYCFDNNLYILRIPFTEKNNIKEHIINTINIITCND